LLAGLDVEEKARAKSAPPRAPEGQSSGNMVQHAGKKNMNPSQTTQFKKKKMNIDEVRMATSPRSARTARERRINLGRNLPT
jgi:hypothetical protein